jgi:hypothetical protein
VRDADPELRSTGLGLPPTALHFVLEHMYRYIALESGTLWDMSLIRELLLMLP